MFEYNSKAIIRKMDRLRKIGFLSDDDYLKELAKLKENNKITEKQYERYLYFFKTSNKNVVF